MRTPESRLRQCLGWLAALAAVSCAFTAVAAGVGRAASPGEIAAFDIDVRPDGRGLPPGSGTAAAGAAIYAQQCSGCHGATGVEGPRDRLVGGRGSLATALPVKTVGSYWPYAPTLYDYIARAMPFSAPGTLQPDEVYALVAFLLHRNGVIAENEVMDRQTLPQVAMANRNGFVVEPEFSNVRRP